MGGGDRMMVAVAVASHREALSSSFSERTLRQLREGGKTRGPYKSSRFRLPPCLLAELRREAGLLREAEPLRPLPRTSLKRHP